MKHRKAHALLAIAPLATLVLSVGLATLAPRVAFAQASVAQIVTKNDLSEADKGVIRDLIERQRPLLSGTAAEVRRAREALVAPLEERGVSVPFRVEMSRQLFETLKTLSADGRDVVAVNALRVAGELATTNSLRVVSDGLKDKRPAVRHGALFAMGRLFMQAARTSPAVSQGDMRSAIAELERIASGESDPLMIDGAISALVAAARAPEGSAAMARMGEAVGVRLRAGAKSPSGAEGAGSLGVGVRGVRELRDAMIGGGGRVAPETVQAAAKLSGQLLVLVREHAKAGVGEPDALAQAAQLAHTTLTLASTSLNGPEIEKLRLALADKAKDPAAFAREVDKLVGPDGVLTKAPFTAKADDFKP
jgi:hypothetical protein